MRSFLKRYQSLWIPGSFLIAALFLLSLDREGPKDMNLFQRAILEISSPLQGGARFAVRSFCDVWDHYLLLVDLKKENLALRERLRGLQALSTQNLELAATAERLRRLLEFKEQIPLPTVAAEVIGNDVSGLRMAIFINKGSSDGIEKGMAVLTPEGVVGQVIQVTPHLAKVLLIVDSNSAIDVIVQPSRIRGILEGRAKDLCELKYVERSGRVQKGERVISSGNGGIYPKGIPVGIVHEVEKGGSGIFQKVTVVPCVDFSKTEEVLVVTRTPLLGP